MNVHHLELFYYVARHGGTMPAVRNIPYGIQQPAVSSQIAQLEEFLGVTLFHRRPFALTPPGEKLFEFIRPFFSNLEKVADELQGGQARHIRIGASTIVLREHLPELFRDVRKKFPGLKLSLREGYPAQFEEWLRKDEIDLAVTLIKKKTAPGIHSLALLELPLILLVEKAAASGRRRNCGGGTRSTSRSSACRRRRMFPGLFRSSCGSGEWTGFPASKLVRRI
jgi:DNA-binding transcriptional LysR family regulator